MKSMISGLFSMLATATALSGGRYASLDSLAAAILDLDSLPTGAALLGLAARHEWVWPLGEVLLSGGQPDSPPDSLAWGIAVSDRAACVVTAPPPAFTLNPPLPVAAHPGDILCISPVGNPPPLRGAALSPSLSVLPVTDGTIVLDEEGTWWIELMTDSEFGPTVLMLSPVDVGSSGAWPGNGWNRDGILRGINGLRRKLGAEPLAESPFLNALAYIRARQARSWGGVLHSFPGSAGTSEMMPPAYGGWAENIASGSDVSEAVQMILVSPFHLASIVDERYGFMGFGTVSGQDGTLLVLILSEASGDGER